jgi:hypothetical protein
MLYADLIPLLKRLSLPADDQLSYLRSIGFGEFPEELALEFDDLYLAVSAKAQGEVRDCIDGINRTLVEMSKSNPDVWSVEALRESSYWEEVRRFARKALRSGLV